MLDTRETGGKPVLSHEELTVWLGRQPRMQSVYPVAKIGLHHAGGCQGGTRQGPPETPQLSPEQ